MKFVEKGAPWADTQWRPFSAHFTMHFHMLFLIFFLCASSIVESLVTFDHV